MEDILDRPTWDIWDEISEISNCFSIDGGKNIEDGNYYDVLWIARSLADRTGEEVNITALFNGKWYQVDVAYPKKYIK